MKFITPGTLLSGCKVFPHFTQSVLPSWLQMYFSFMVPMLSCTDCNLWPCARLRFSLSGAERTVAHAATVAHCSNGRLSRNTKLCPERSCRGRCKGGIKDCINPSVWVGLNLRQPSGLVGALCKSLPAFFRIDVFCG